MGIVFRNLFIRLSFWDNWKIKNKVVQFEIALDFQLFPSCDKRKLVTKILRHNRKIYLLCFIRNFRRSEELI